MYHCQVIMDVNGIMLKDSYKDYFEELLNARDDKEKEENCLEMGLLEMKGMNVRI